MLRVAAEEAEAVAVRVDPEAVMRLVIYLCLTSLLTRQRGAHNHRNLQHHENRRVVDHGDRQRHHRHHRHYHPDLDPIIDLNLRVDVNAMMS